MNKNIIRKLLVSALCVVTVLAMSVTAFAATDLTNGAATGEITDINIGKTLMVSNPNLASVDGPGASYSYAVAGVAPSASNGGTTVTDGTNTFTVTAGPTDGVTLTTSSVSWPVGTAVNASAAGTANTKNIVAHLDATKFSVPGVYRYEITETPSLGTTGVTDNGTRTRYLDVYIVNDTNGVKIAGCVLHDAGGTKTNKFNDAEFETVNITLRKSVGGSFGDKENQFPFTGTVIDSGRYFYAKKGTAPTAVSANQIAGVAAGSSISTTLADTEVYYISGVSKTATVSYTEQNNTAETYSVGINNANFTPVAPNGTKTMAATAVTSASDTTFNNDLGGITPTGVIFRFGAPLALILVAGALIALNRRSKAMDK